MTLKNRSYVHLVLKTLSRELDTKQLLLVGLVRVLVPRLHEAPDALVICKLGLPEIGLV